MALNPYSKVGWQNSPAQTTPVNATNLNKMDEQLYDVTEHLINLDAADLPYDNTASGMTATTMQTAIDEVYKPTFSQALTRANIDSGESIPTLFGKIKKFFADLKTVAFSGSYTDLSNKPTIGNGTLTIQKNGTNVATFTANQTGNATANITVPTVNNGTLTIQKNGTNVGTFTANQSGNSTVNIPVPTDTNDLSNGAGYITRSINGSFKVNGTYSYEGVFSNNIQPYSGGELRLVCSEKVSCRNSQYMTSYMPIEASAFNVQSSKRFKHDINDMTEEMALGLLSLRPVTFFYNGQDDKQCEGLIAEEVAEVDAFSVSYDEEGLPAAIDYSKFVPQLIKLCQIQQRQIDELTSRIEALEGK